MITAFCFFLSTFSFLGVMYLLIKNFAGVEKDEKEKKTKNSGFYLPKIKELPKSHEVDTKLSLLRDVIKTCKNEAWTASILEESYSFRKTYSIDIDNPQNNLKIKARLRLGSDDKECPKLVNFVIIDESGVITYGDNEDANIICLNFIWNEYFIPYTNKLCDDEVSRYEGIKKSISDKLLSLKRQQKLDDLDI